ncbi:unnamed protein product [Nezara viridula]|uniref:Transmembrane protein 161B n=1 Tax=Nezara viridula TaxID=85310 RepID=A0A9P0HGW8_NEZVI|nr:unnamed protein product [Nezara viridula]
MALLGAQLVITLVMVSIIQKIGKHYSLARGLICSTGLIRYLYPTDDELRSLAGVIKEKQKGKKDRKYHENGVSANSTFHVPRNLDFQLESAKVSFLDVVHLRYYTEYQWLLDFSFYSFLVYLVSEIYTYFFPLVDEFNLSMLWCFLVILSSMKMLLYLTLEYFKADESIGERSTVIVTFFSYLIVAMAILLVDEKTLESGLETAYNSFNASAHTFLEKNGLNSEGPASKLFLKFIVAVWCALIGSFFTFPGLRLARMHWDSLRYCESRILLKIALNISFASPFVLVLLWVTPLSRHYLTKRIFSGFEEPLLSEDAFETIRLWLLVVTSLLRIILIPQYLQAYLNIAYMRVAEMKKEAGRITNKELQKKIAAVFYYMCVVALQYLIPVFLCLFYAFMYKTLGEFSWIGKPDTECMAPDHTEPLNMGDSVLASAQEFSLALNSLKQVMTKDVARGLFGFATWWTCFAMFASSSIGLLYQTYFRNVA